jgi:beta-1,4-mannosyltransferase
VKPQDKMKFFLSPIPSSGDINSYLTSFHHALQQRVQVVNERPVSRAIDLLKGSVRSNVMIVNWPEDIIFLRFGFPQLVLSALTLALYRTFGGTIVWVCHNKDSHVKKWPWLRRLIRRFYSKVSSHIIVHASNAVQHFDEHASQKVHYFPHPAYTREVNNSDAMACDIDVLIWGTISRYKGLTEFVQNYVQHACSFQVRIVGKADPVYFDELKQLTVGLNIQVENRYLSADELNALFQRSRIILLPYIGEDTFSSGALIHSLNANKIIVGPAAGNFIDLAKAGACLTYSNSSELFSTLKSLLLEEGVYASTLFKLRRGILDYLTSNQWDGFAGNLVELIVLGNQKLVLEQKS